MNGKDCRAVRREIDSSELSQRLNEPLEAHLAACAGCAQFRAERRQLRELVGSLQPVAAPADFDVRLRARMAREREQQPRQPFIFRFAMTTPAIAAAALVVMLVGAVVWINQRKPTNNLQTAVAPDNRAPIANSTGSAGVNESNTGSQQNKDVVATNDQPANPKPGKASGNPSKSSPPANSPARVADFSTRGAPSIPIRQDRDGEVSLAAPSKPMVVSVQDANGATHKILLPPISFGSQRFDSRTPVNLTNRRDW